MVLLSRRECKLAERSFNDRLMESLKISEKHGIPAEQAVPWMIHEDTANTFLMYIFKEVGPEKTMNWLRELSRKVFGVPLTETQAKTYEERMKIYMKKLEEMREEK